MESEYQGLEPLAALIRKEEEQLLEKEIQDLQEKLAKLAKEADRVVQTVAKYSHHCAICKGVAFQVAVFYRKHYRRNNNPNFSPNLYHALTRKTAACARCKTIVCRACLKRHKIKNRYCRTCRKYLCNKCVQHLNHPKGHCK